MNYNYEIKDEKVYEFEGRQNNYDSFSHTIKFLVEESFEKSSAFSVIGKRKLKWLKENHPEFFI